MFPPFCRFSLPIFHKYKLNYSNMIITDTVWPEILAGIYFGGLMKLLHLAEFTLAVRQALCHNNIHSKWLIQNGQELHYNDELWLRSTHAVV